MSPWKYLSIALGLAFLGLLAVYLVRTLGFGTGVFGLSLGGAVGALVHHQRRRNREAQDIALWEARAAEAREELEVQTSAAEALRAQPLPENTEDMLKELDRLEGLIDEPS